MFASQVNFDFVYGKIYGSELICLPFSDRFSKSSAVPNFFEYYIQLFQIEGL